MTRVRAIFGTWFGESADDIIKHCEQRAKAWIVGPYELCPETGRKHLHFYMSFAGPQYVAKVGKSLGCFCEPALGSWEQAMAYACKNGLPLSVKKLEQGKRNDLSEIVARFDKLDDLIDEEPTVYCRYRNGLKEIFARKEMQCSEEFKPETHWICGPTGCGKTLSAIKAYPTACVLHCCKDMWFDEYNGAETVIFDEFRHDSIEYTTLLAMLTWNKGMKMRIKGAFVWFHPRRIIFTSPELPEQEFSYRRSDEQRTLRSDFAQLKRRLDYVWHWNEHLRIWAVNRTEVLQG